FLLGSRGTGKTTVMASLYEATRAIEGSVQGTEWRQVERKEVRDDLQGIASRLQWLEPLDMETVDESTNLLSAILVCVDQLFTNRGLQDGETFSDLLDDDGDALLMLQQMERKIAMAWTTAGPQTLRSADLEMVALDSLKLENTRLGLTDGLYKVFDALNSMQR